MFSVPSMDKMETLRGAYIYFASCSRRWQAMSGSGAPCQPTICAEAAKQKGAGADRELSPNPTPSAEPFSAARPNWLGGRNLIAPDSTEYGVRSRRGPNADDFDLPSCSIMLRVSRASGLSHPSGPGKY